MRLFCTMFISVIPIFSFLEVSNLELYCVISFHVA